MTQDWLPFTVFLVCAGFILYTYAGYPLLMLALQRLRAARRTPGTIAVPQAPPASASASASPTADEAAGAGAGPGLPALTVIVVVHNAQDLIERKLASILASDYPADRLQVVVFSDGSTDETEARVRACPDSRVGLLRGLTRRGKAACLNDAIAACTSSILVLTDARQRLAAAALRHLVIPFADPKVGAVSGALEIEGGGSARDALQDQAAVVASAADYWRIEKLLRAAEADLHSAIGVTGALYALRRQVYAPIPPETILDDVLIPMNAVLAGHRVLFEARAQAFDAPSRSEAQERQRKVRTLAGNFQLLALRPSLLVPWTNPVWWQFISHKLFRIMAPLALLGLLLSSCWLARDSLAFALLAAIQILAYTLALLPGSASGFRSLRAVRSLRGFLRLQWCAVLGFVWFLRTPSPQLWQTTQHGTGSGTPVSGESGP